MRFLAVALALLSLTPLAAAATPADPACGLLPNSPAPAQLACLIAAGLAWGIAQNAAQPPSTPGPGVAQHPVEACGYTHFEIDRRVGGVGWYSACIAQTDLGSVARIFYTQRKLSCTADERSCTYEPTFHARLETFGAGEWILRATTREIYYPGSGGTTPGTIRNVECTVVQGNTACEATAVNSNVVGSNLQSAKWDGSWTLWLRDSAGALRLMSHGASSGYLAQYCSCEP